jgi:hypothetical protein
MYLDANNLYGHSMSQKLPTGKFEWLYKFDIDFLKRFDCNGDYGLFVECDLNYPKELHDLHNNYPLAVEKRNVKESELSPYQLNQLSNHNEKHSEKINK